MNTRWEVEKFCKEKQRALDGEGGLFRAVDRGRRGRIYRCEVGDVQEQREDDSDCYGNEWGAQQSCFKKCKGRMLLVLKKGDPVVAVSAVDEVPNGSVGWVRGIVRASLPSGRPTGRMGLDYRRCGIEGVAFVEAWKYVGSVGCEDASGVVDGAWPVVEFVVKGERVKKTVPPKLMIVEGADGEAVCCRFQVPLLLAYAFTVHRVQGRGALTVVYNMSRIFAAGQFYTAASRGGEWERLWLLGTLKEGARLNDPRVLEFQRQIRWTGIYNPREDGVSSVVDGVDAEVIFVPSQSPAAP
eukprot:jgi/Botrbrau1/19064/Bobra.0795s0001.1